MAGTRTAPTVGAGTQTTLGVTIHLIDASGDLFTEYVVASTDDLVDIEAFVNAYQPATQASVWKVSFTQEWEGEADPDNAESLFRGSVSDGINLLFKDVPAQAKQTPRLVAPVASVMQGDFDIPTLVSPSVLPALVTQYLTLLGGAYGLDSMQFTERRERRNNPRIKV